MARIEAFKYAPRPAPLPPLPALPDLPAAGESGERAEQEPVLVPPPPKPIRMSDVTEESFVLDATGIAPLDAVLGGGAVVGSVVVLAAHPGIGKSTLLAQALSGMNVNALYISAEEIVSIVANRARRVKAATKKVLIVRESDVDKIIAHARDTHAQVVGIDSIQKLSCSDVDGFPGSALQMKSATIRLGNFAKKTRTTVFMISQVNAEGGVSGPKALEHEIDVLMYLELAPNSERILRCYNKNRFASTNVIGRFRMTKTGLEPIGVGPGPQDDDDDPNDDDTGNGGSAPSGGILH